MADRMYGDVLAGATSVSVEVLLRSSTDSSPVTGVAYTSVTAYFYRQGEPAPIQISMASLASGNTPWSSGGWFQIHATNYPGRYRFDVPNTVFALGSTYPTPDWVGVQVRATGCLPFDAQWRVQSASMLAEQVLLLDWTTIAATVPARSLLNAARFLRNRWDLTATTLSVKKEDDSTEAWNGTVTTSAGADPVSGIDPG